MRPQVYRQTRYCLAALAPIAVLMLWYSQTRAFSWDEGYHLLAAQLVAHGKRPYLDFCFPQPPLNTLWNALWMRIAGESWRVIHAVAVLLVWGAAWLASGYARWRGPSACHAPIRRGILHGSASTECPDESGHGRPEARATFSLAILTIVGLNVLIVQWGLIGQAYALALIAIVAAFRLALRAVEEEQPRLTALAGFAAGCGACATLLTAPVGIVLLVWIFVYNQQGNRWKKVGALIAGEAASFLPMLWLFVQNPAATFFNVVRYELAYRQVEWEGAYAHDANVWISWVDSSHGVIIAVLAAGGLAFVKYRSGWPRAQRAEIYLAAWLAGALLLHVSQAHPTFAQYYMLAIPFLAVLCGTAIYALRTNWAAIALAILMALGLAKAIAEENAYTWHTFDPIVRRVEEIAPRGAPILADEQIYFLTRRTPPSGMELNDSHKLDFAADEMRALHLVAEGEIERRIHAREFALVESCGEYETFDDAAAQSYPHKEKVGNCTLYW